MSVIFLVAGHGTFPIDMLRYDQCYPLSHEDVLSVGLNCSELRAKDSKRVAKLYSEHRTVPTLARWASFGWTVISHDASGYELSPAEVASNIEMHLFKESTNV